MSSATENPRRTAAWRLSIRTTLAFALGIALAFMVIYHMVAQTIHERTDAWLSGEAEVLGDVAMNTHQDRLYNRIVAETAELATREVPAEDPEDRSSQSQAVFFLQAPDDEKPVLWVGPGSKETFLRALQAVSFTPGVPRSVNVDGFANSFRVVIN